jgi:hypothetical protein
MRVGARHAAMVVHSFSPADAWLEDYRAFARLMGVEGEKGRLERVPRHVGVELWMGWVTEPHASTKSSDTVIPRAPAYLDSVSNRGRCLPRSSFEIRA